MLTDYQKSIRQQMSEAQGKPIRCMVTSKDAPNSLVILFADSTSIRIDTDIQGEASGHVAEGQILHVAQTAYYLPKGGAVGTA
jgi:hypothetical protein